METWVYVLWSHKLRKRYVGCAENVELRLRQHNAGKTPFTRSGIPWTVVHTEVVGDRVLARQRERFLKSGQGRAWLDKLFPEFTRRRTTL